MQKDVNFFSIYRSPAESDNGVDKITVISLSIIAACLVAFAGSFTYLKIADLTALQRAREIKAYLSSTEVIKARADWGQYTTRLNALKNYQQKATAQTNAFKGLLTVDSFLLNSLLSQKPADVTLQKLALSGDKLTLTCTSTDKLSPARFVAALHSNPQVASVEYNGVEPSATIYNFTVTCQIKGGDGK